MMREMRVERMPSGHRALRVSPRPQSPDSGRSRSTAARDQRPLEINGRSRSTPWRLGGYSDELHRETERSVGAQVLRRNGGRCTERAGGRESPVGVAQKNAREEDEVRTAFT